MVNIYTDSDYNQHSESSIGSDFTLQRFISRRRKWNIYFISMLYENHCNTCAYRKWKTQKVMLKNIIRITLYVYFQHGLSLCISFCYRIHQEMVLPLFRKCCQRKLNSTKKGVEMTSAGITIRNTIESSSGSIIDYEENETKVAIHDEKNLVFPLLSKTFFSTRFKDRI